MDTAPGSSRGPNMVTFPDAGGRGPGVDPPPNDAWQSGAPIPGIGAVSDNAVAQDTAGAFADGEPVSPYLAARRYGASAGQGMRGNGDPGSP